MATIRTPPARPSSTRFENQRRTLFRRLPARTLRRAGEKADRIASMSDGRAKQLVFGSPGGIAGTVYGTIVVMATVTAGAHGKATDAGRLAVVVGVTVLVLWMAHVYAHGLAESLERAGGSTARSSPPSPGASWPFPRPPWRLSRRSCLRPSAFSASQTAVWLALGIGVVTLGVQGARYAAVEQLDRTGTLTADRGELLLGLVIVGLKALVAH